MRNTTKSRKKRTECIILSEDDVENRYVEGSVTYVRRRSYYKTSLGKSGELTVVHVFFLFLLFL